MATAVTIHDEATIGGPSRSFQLQLARERLTVRELIERRVAHEVEAYNRSQTEYYLGLIQPADAERTLNGFRMRKPRPLDPDKQCAKALDAFQANGFVLLVGNRQVERLDEEVTLTPQTEVRFVKLVPLIGG